MKSRAPQFKNNENIANRAYYQAAEMPVEVSSQPPPEFLRITRAVEHRQNGKGSVFDGEVYIVTSKPAHMNLSSLLTNFWEAFRIGFRTLQSVICFQKEFLSQTWAPLFIPNGCLVIFNPCSRFENEPETHFQPNRLLSSALTCSQGIPSCGLASKSARRRSSSAACSGVRSESYPSSATISQKSCASLILSSFGSAFAALRISAALMLQNYSGLAGGQAANSPVAM